MIKFLLLHYDLFVPNLFVDWQRMWFLLLLHQRSICVSLSWTNFVASHWSDDNIPNMYRNLSNWRSRRKYEINAHINPWCWILFDGYTSCQCSFMSHDNLPNPLVYFIENTHQLMCTHPAYHSNNAILLVYWIAASRGNEIDRHPFRAIYSSDVSLFKATCHQSIENRKLFIEHSM